MEIESIVEEVRRFLGRMPPARSTTGLACWPRRFSAPGDQRGEIPPVQRPPHLAVGVRCMMRLTRMLIFPFFSQHPLLAQLLDLLLLRRLRHLHQLLLRGRRCHRLVLVVIHIRGGRSLARLRYRRDLRERQTSRNHGQQQKPQKSVHDVNVEPAMLSDAFEQVNLLRRAKKPSSQDTILPLFSTWPP